jgi:hypothetical protein
MKPGKITVEYGIYCLAFLIALGIRFLALGTSFLSDQEATWALQAVNLAKNSHALIGAQPAYVLLTSALFYMLPSTEWLARFWPALVGSLLALSPFMFRKHLGKAAALCLAFFLALDPGMVAASRHAGDGIIMAVTFVVLAFGFYLQGQPALMGISAGLALLSGPELWPGLLALALVAGWSAVSKPVDAENHPAQATNTNPPASVSILPPIGWRRVLIWTAVTLFIVGTGFFFAPQGLSAIFTSLAAYLKGWGVSPAFTPLRMLAALAVYSPLVLLLGLAGAVHGFVRGEKIDAFLSYGLLVTLLLVIFYPGRQVSDLVWPLVPLMALAAREISRIKILDYEDWYISLGQMGIIFALLAFMWLNVSWLVNVNPGELGVQDAQLHLAGIAGAALLIVVISVLVVWGWSLRAAMSGLAGAIGVILIIFTLSGTFNAAGLGYSPAAELWRSSPYVQEGNFLKNSLGDVSEWNTGRRDWLDLSVISLPSPALHWMLRNWKNVSFIDQIAPDAKPSLVITHDQKNLSLGAAYTGQSFALGQMVNWSKTQPSTWINWFMFRTAVYDQDIVVLWVRSDLFPGAGPDTTPHYP